VAPYLTPAQVRSRITSGSPVLDSGRFSDTWVAEQIEVWEATLEDHTGDAYVPRTATVTLSVPSRTTRLRLPNMRVTAVSSVTIDGTAIVLDTQQPDYAIGVIRYATGFLPQHKIVAAYTYGHTTVPTVVKVATARYVEQMASLDRSGSTRDVYRVGFDGGGTTAYVMPDPANGKLTGYDAIDSLVRTLDHMHPPRVR